MRRVGVIMTGPFQEALAVLKTSPEELTAEGQALMQGGDRPTGQRFLNTANAFDAGPALENRLVQGQGINAARAMNQLVGSNDNKEELANYARLLYDEGRESPDYHEARDNPDYRGKDELQAFYEAMSKLHHGKKRVAGMNEAAESQLSQLRADDPSQFWADQRVRTGEPMKDAWSSLLKGKELQDFLQEYPDIKFQSNEVQDSPLSDETLDYGNTTHGKTSHLNTIGDNARSRTMNPQRMDMLSRLAERGSKKNPTIIQQVHRNAEDPYFAPPDMLSPPLRTEYSNPENENDDFYESIDYEEPISQEMWDEHVKRYGIQTSEPMTGAWSSLLKELSGDEPYRTPTCLTCGRGFATPEDLEYHYSVSGHAPLPYEKPSDDDADDWSNYDPNKNQGEY